MSEESRVQSEHYHEEWSWASLTRDYVVTDQLGADGYPGTDEYPEFMTDALVECFAALESWVVPLALSLDFDIAGEPFRDSPPSIMLLANELTEDVILRQGWQEWAEPKPVEQITGGAIRTIAHQHLTSLKDQTGKPHELRGIQFLACRFAIGPDTLPEEFVLSSWRGSEHRTVRTTTSNGQRWISEPQTENQVFLPVSLEITSTGARDFELNFRMDPAWSYFGDKDEPGWQMITDTAERLLATSDNWSLRRLEPGDPSKR